MSLKWDWSLALPSGLPLSDIDCLHLLDEDSNDASLDIFNNLTSTTKLEPFDNGSPSGLAYSPTHSLYSMSPLEDCKPSRSELANKLLNELDQCKEESFSDWLEEKVDLPIFEQYSALPEPIRACPVEVPPASLIVQAPPSHNYDLHYVPESAPQHYYGEQPRTQDLLREFDKVYVAVEATHLTPPQSPPGPATQLLLSLQAPYAAQQQHYAEPPPAPVADSWRRPEIEAVVDEIVRHSAGTMQPRAPLSPASSPRSPPASPASPSTSASHSSSGDEEWAPRSARSKPYARSPDDKRSRKKEQNKNAATRYRQKKKAEVEVLLGEEHALRQRQDELHTKCSDVQREIRYLKGLMRDLFKAKGLIK